MSRKKKNLFEIKLEAVKLYLEKNIGSTTIAKELGLTDGRRVMLRVKRYKEFGQDGLKERLGAAKGLSKGKRSSKKPYPYRSKVYGLKKSIFFKLFPFNWV